MRIENTEITTVVSDFDGTLIKKGAHVPSQRFYAVVEELLRRGIGFVAASGRQYPNLKLILGDVADKIGFIAENGALVVWKGEVLHKCTVQRSLGEELLEDLKRQPEAELLVSGEKTSYILDTNPEYIYLLEHQVKNVITVLKDFSQIEEDMLKISIYYPNGIPREAELFFREKYGSRLLVLESGNGWLDFMPPESGKGNALKVLSEKMGFDLSKTVAFGDSENDISMLQTAAVSFAMSTASEQVKSSAHMVCDCVEEVLENALEKEQKERIETALKILRDYIYSLSRQAGESEEYATQLWQRMEKSGGVLQELAYYHDYGKFLCRYQVEGYTLADILVWQVDHFKAYMDRPLEMNRYHQERLLLSAFDIMLKMEENPAPYVAKMQSETGTDFVGKFKEY